MSAISYDTPEQDWEDHGTDVPGDPARPRRRFFNRKSAALAAVVTCAAGFYAGIRVEKSQLTTTPSAATASQTGATVGAPARTAGSATAGAPGGGGGFPGTGRFGGGTGAGNATFGSISSVNGNTIYLTDPTGDTIKVTLSSATKLTKGLSVSKSALHPGDTTLIQGVKNSTGTLVATSVTDNGPRTAGSGASSNSGSASGG